MKQRSDYYSEVLDLYELQCLLKVSQATAKKMLYSGEIKGKKLGGQWRILKSNVVGTKPVPTDKVFGIDELCFFLKMSRSTVSKLLNSGELRGIKTGRSWRIPKQMVIDCLI